MITRNELRDHFPWLGTDEPVSGADVIQDLVCWFLAETAEKKAELKTHFPWLGTEEPVDGADVVDYLVFWYLLTPSEKTKEPVRRLARFWGWLRRCAEAVLGRKKNERYNSLERS